METDAILSSVFFLLIHITATSTVVSQTDNQCPTSCRCLDRSSIVVCADVSHVPAALPASTLLLDLDHNRISLLPNSSFRSSSLRRLEILSIQDNGLLHIESGALGTLHELRILRLGRNHLSTLPKDLLSACRRLQVLDLHANYLATLPDYVVYHVHGLQLLNVSFNHLTSPRLGSGFRFTTQLSQIDMSGNDFATIESDAFEVCQWWDDQVPRYINLSYCDIRHIRPLAFNSIPRLHTLSLEGNLRLPQGDVETALVGVRAAASLDTVVVSHANITDVQSLVRQLQAATNVSKLDLSFNRIRVVPKRAFFFLSGLRHLDLSHNEISVIESLAGLSRLEFLGLAFNGLERLDSEMFEGLHELRVLDLSHNSLSGNFDSEPLTVLFNLHTIDISCNRIRTVTVDEGLESLEVLSAAWNRITDVRFLGRLPRLRVVDVGRNSIARLGPELFPLGQRLRLANFSGNTISELSSTSFRLASFDVLDLSFNRLASLSNAGWTSVGVLALHDNDLVNVSADALRGLDSSLAELHLQRNSLRSMPKSVLDPPAASLRLLDISSNPLGAFVESNGSTFHSLSRLGTLRLRDVGLMRWPTSALHNLVSLTTLDLAENRLQSVPTDALTNLSRLVHLDLSSNQFAQFDPRPLTAGRRVGIDLSTNPLDCTCALLPLCHYLFPLPVSDDPTTRNRTLYRCRSPTEWAAVPLAEFCIDSAQQCSSLTGTFVAAAVGAVLVVLAFSLTVALCRRCIRARRDAVHGGKVGCGKAAGRLDSYQFVDETSLTSSSNSSSTTTSGGQVPAGPNPLPTNLLLAKQWL